MLLTTLLCAATLQAVDYDGLTMEMPAKPTPQTVGSSKVYQGVTLLSLDGKVGGVKETFALTVTDLSKLEQKPTKEQLLVAFERAIRTKKPLAAINLRRTMAKIGSHDLIVLTGSAIAPNEINQPLPAGFVCIAFTAGDKFYEYMVLSMAPNLEHHLDDVIAMTYGTAKEKVTGLSRDLKGDYTIAGLPFTFTATRTPYPDVTAPDSTYANQYGAAAVVAGEYDHRIIVRQIKPEDKRTDSEIFAALARYFTVNSVDPSKFVVQNGSATVTVSNDRMGQQLTSKMRFERVGAWIAITVTNVPVGKPANLAGFDLRATRPAPGGV